MTDHDGCTVTSNGIYEQHDCPPCAHGVNKGCRFVLRGDATDAATRRLKLRALDQQDCSDASHVEAVAKLEQGSH